MKSRRDLDLLIAAIVLLLLFAATYSGRGTWIALGSTALWAALIACWFLLATPQYAAPFLSAMAERLPNGWSREAQQLAKAIESASASLQSSRKPTAAEPRQPISASAVSQWFDGQWSNPQALDLGTPDVPNAEVEREQSATRQPQTESMPAPAKSGSQSAGAHGPVKWITDRPRSRDKATILLAGANQSDEPLEEVRATLKPDSDTGGSTNVSPQKVLRLRLRVEGQAIDGKSALSIPPGARFHLEAPDPTAEQAQLSSGIVSFAYVQAGRRRTSIMYLPQAALSVGSVQ